MRAAVVYDILLQNRGNVNAGRKAENMGIFLRDGGTIGFVAPSFGCATEPYQTAFNNALRRLRERGFQTVLGPNCYRGDGIGISAPPAECAQELADMFCRDDIDALMACGGGEMMCETLGKTDWERIRAAKPKLLMGYSDITNFIFPYVTMCGGYGIYGPCASAFGMEPWHSSIEDALALMQGKIDTVRSYPAWEGIDDGKKDEEHPLAPYNCVQTAGIHKYIQGSTCVERTSETVCFAGRLLGGCLDCLQVMCGTPYQDAIGYAESHKEEGIVWVLEACDLNVFGIRRALWQLREAGWFAHVKGFLIGRPLCYGQEMMGLDHYHAVLDILGELGVPIVMDADIGHLPPHMPLLMGSYASVTADEKISITMRL